DFLLRGEELHLADLAQVEFDRGVGVVTAAFLGLNAGVFIARDRSDRRLHCGFLGLKIFRGGFCFFGVGGFGSVLGGGFAWVFGRLRFEGQILFVVATMMSLAAWFRLAPGGVFVEAWFGFGLLGWVLALSCTVIFRFVRKFLAMRARCFEPVQIVLYG